MLKKRLLWTAIIVLAVTGAVTGHIDRASEEQAENALKNALVTFAVARTLNGVISAAQGTEVALEPGGVGVVLSVGEVLDPINDLVERFSSVMLIAASSLGLQMLLLNITSWWGVSGFLIAAAAGFLVVIWAPRSTAAQYAGPALRILLFLLFVRFAVPVLIVGTTLISDAFLEPKQAEATAILRDTSKDIERISDEAQTVPPDDQSFMERLGEMIDESLESMRVGDAHEGAQGQRLERRRAHRGPDRDLRAADDPVAAPIPVAVHGRPERHRRPLSEAVRRWRRRSAPTAGSRPRSPSGDPTSAPGTARSVRRTARSRVRRSPRGEQRRTVDATSQC